MLFENNKVQQLQKQNNRLKDEIKTLRDENKELKAKLEKGSDLIEAAEKYRDEHRRALLALAAAKQQYETLIKQVVEDRKKYTEEMESLLKIVKK